MYKVSINLVTWNGKKYLPYCLKSIENQTFSNFFLLILDNGSTDGTAEYLKNYKFRIANYKIIFNEKNVGFAAGHNMAIRNSDSEYILMLNQDIVLAPNFLETVVKFLDQNPKVGTVTGKLLRWDYNADSRRQGVDSCKQVDLRGLTNFLDSCGLKIFKSHRVVELGAGKLDGKEWDTAFEVFGVSGAAPVYRRKALEDVAVCSFQKSIYTKEFLDEDFFSYKEDVDLAYRLRLYGWQSWFLPQAVAWHDRSAKAVGNSDFGIMRARKIKSDFVNYHSYKNHLFFLVKNLTPKIFLSFFPWIFWYELRKFVYILFFETKTLKSLNEFFRKLPAMWKKRKQIMANKKVKTAEISRWLE
jgi:GT2 family glycosyltransferase